MSIQQAHADFRLAENSKYNRSPTERKELYISAAKQFLSIAKNVQDKSTKASVVYLAALAASKAEVIVDSDVIGPIDPQSGSFTSKAMGTDVMKTNNGRLISFPNVDVTAPLEHIVEAPKMSTRDYISDLLVLEHKLNDLG
jgi:hypothetical protein